MFTEVYGYKFCSSCSVRISGFSKKFCYNSCNLINIVIVMFRLTIQKQDNNLQWNSEYIPECCLIVEIVVDFVFKF